MHLVLAQYCEYHADAWLQGRIYEIDGYPGAIETAEVNDRVYGELYKIHAFNTLIEKLDMYEECTSAYPEPHEYVRKRVNVTAGRQGVSVAWAYLFTGATQGLLQITSGDYLQFLEMKRQASA